MCVVICARAFRRLVGPCVKVSVALFLATLPSFCLPRSAKFQKQANCTTVGEKGRGADLRRREKWTLKSLWKHVAAFVRCAENESTGEVILALWHHELMLFKRQQLFIWSFWFQHSFTRCIPSGFKLSGSPFSVFLHAKYSRCLPWLARVNYGGYKI